MAVMKSSIVELTTRAESIIPITERQLGNRLPMVAGKIPGIRAATVHDTTSARLTREHNDANVIGIGARFVAEQMALDMVEAYLAASFEGGRHQQRIEKLDALDSADEGST
jgi:ribose 5-phosphate isomerase B